MHAIFTAHPQVPLYFKRTLTFASSQGKQELPKPTMYDYCDFVLGRVMN